ncbi:MAG TPA: zinc-binding dehydrogenase [Chloroflexota bacterium]|nr:zinc-binding dehydrogenase [Chloroflexota bacterium]
MSEGPGATMRGVLGVAPREVRVVEVARPQLEPGTAIVRVRASGICGSDLHLYRARGEPETRPAGHEVAGEVVEIAPRPGEASRLREGDRVALDTICLGRACGECRWCREGAPFHCESKRQGPDWSGAFAEYVKRDVRGLFPLPQHVSLEEGALVEPLAVGVHAVRRAGLRPGETVAVIGVGTIGLASVMAAKALGAGAVYALARHPFQADLALALGATEALTDPPDEAAQRVRQETGGGADVVIETVGGHATTLDQAWALVRRKGRVIVLGVFEGAVPVRLGPALGKEADVRFAVCYGELDGRHDYDVTLELIASGKAPVGRLLTHRFPLQEAPLAFRTADDKASGAVKVQLIP